MGSSLKAGVCGVVPTKVNICRSNSRCVSYHSYIRWVGLYQSTASQDSLTELINLQSVTAVSSAVYLMSPLTAEEIQFRSERHHDIRISVLGQNRFFLHLDRYPIKLGKGC